MRIQVLPEHSRAAQLDLDQLRGHKSQNFTDRWSAINWLKRRAGKVTNKLKNEAAIAKEEVV